MARAYRSIAIALVILFLAAVARFYHPGTGFTALIGFPPEGQFESEALKRVPHYQHPAFATYDGQFYAQRALDPLFRDPTTERGMDLAPYRGRRILFSWTAYALGIGRPFWILQAFALQNVVCWLMVAAVLTRWLRPVTGRGLALWIACLFSHGLLWSVRFALLDGPSLLLTMIAVVAIEAGHPLWSSSIVGLNALGRETNIIAVLAQPVPRALRDWWRLLVALALAALPTLIWLDFLRAIYRSTTLAGTNTVVLPGAGIVASWRGALFALAPGADAGRDAMPACMLLAICVQAAFVLVRRRDRLEPWWRVAFGFAVLFLILDRSIVDPHNGGLTRVMLPLTVGFNVLLAKEPRPARFWAWFLAGNVHLIPALYVLPLVP
jgi:hypothetical protein